MRTSVALMPLVAIFVFILSALLITKGGNVGRIIFGLVVLAVFFLVGAHQAAGQPQGDTMGVLAITPLVAIAAPVLFILAAILITKGGNVGRVVFAFMILAVLLFLAYPTISHREVRYASEEPAPAVAAPEPPIASVAVESRAQPEPSIWMPGIEDQFEADVYPSLKSAVRAIGSRMNNSIQELTSDSNAPVQITLFQEASSPVLIVRLRDAIQQAMPQTSYAIEADLRDLRPNEVGITMQFSGMGAQPAPWTHSSEPRVMGVVHVHVFTMNRRVIPQVRFVEMPWVEDFASFLNSRPNARFLVARSTETCTSQAEADQQAMMDAVRQLTLLTRQVRAGHRDRSLFDVPITVNDVLGGNFIADRFVQSFEGTSGKIWRQALLIDSSQSKLAALLRSKVAQVRVEQYTWARTILSIAGTFILIVIVYALLNAATKGYYEWSLRVAGLLLAVVSVVLFLLYLS